MGEFEALHRNVLAISIWLIVCVMYLCLGMVLFVALEGENTKNIITHKMQLRETLKTDFLTRFNISQPDFDEFMKRAVEAYSPMPTKWSYLNAFAFVLQTVTTIGYGYITPITTSGRVFCIFYALFGIPLAALLLQATGKGIFESLFALLTWLEKRIRASSENIKYAEIKSLVASLVLLALVILFYSVVFVYGYQQGTMVEGVYSWFITLTTIGYGDIVPGEGKNSLTMVWLRVVFMFVGLSITASVLSSLATCIEKRRNSKFCQGCRGRTGRAIRVRWTGDGSDTQIEGEGTKVDVPAETHKTRD